MSRETIDAAILAHRSWVSRFKTALHGINTEFFDLPSTVDTSACSLGRWLLADDSRAILGAAAHHQIEDLHERFHQICGILATQLNQRQVEHEHPNAIRELDALSKQIVHLLLAAR